MRLCDCALSGATVTCTRTNGTSFGSLATANSVNLSSQASGVLQATQFPALSGDVTTAAGSLATTVGKIGGESVTLAGPFSTAGAYGVTLTATGATNVTLPASGALATTANIAAALPSAATSQLYAGSGGAGVAAPVTTGSGVYAALGTALGAANGFGGVSANNTYTGNNTHAGIETFTGTSSNVAALFTNAAEPATINASTLGATLSFYFASQSVYVSTANQTANWTVNFALSSGATLNSALAVGQTVTAVVVASQGTTAYYNAAVQIDGTAATPYWQGGAAPAAGNASGYDVYTYTITKLTSTPTYLVLASLTQF